MQSLPRSTPIILGIFIVAVGAGTTLQFGKKRASAKPSPARSARAQSAGQTGDEYSRLGDQYAEDVDQVLEQRERAVSEFEWSRSGFLPSDVIDAAMALKNPAASREICKILGTLSSQELVTFEAAISRPESSKFLPCFNTLRKKLEDFWDQARGRFAVASSADAQFDAPVSIAVEEGAILDGESLPEGHVALSFDGGPDPLRTPQILDMLKRAGAKASFFMTGDGAQANSALAQRMVEEGHTIGTIGLKNVAISVLNVKAAEDEMEKGRSGVASAAGAPVRFFRFPFGEASEFYQNFVTQKKMATFFWNIDSDDWKLSEPEQVLKNILTQLDAPSNRHRGIIRLHDSATQTGILLPSLLQELRGRKMQLVIFR